MSEFSTFDTQIQIEETNTYEPTAADMAEFYEWLGEQDANERERELELDAATWDAFDGHSELYEDEDEDFQLSAPEDWDDEEGSLGEMSTLDGFELDYEPEDDYYDYVDLMEY